MLQVTRLSNRSQSHNSDGKVTPQPTANQVSVASSSSFDNAIPGLSTKQYRQLMDLL